MPHINSPEVGGMLSDDRTWSYQVGSFYSGGSPHAVVTTFPTGSFATTHRRAPDPPTDRRDDTLRVAA
jgi:hypothetical protein